MSNPSMPPQQPVIAVADVLTDDLTLDEAISDEEANAEIDFLDLADPPMAEAQVAASPTAEAQVAVPAIVEPSVDLRVAAPVIAPPAAPDDDITPSVRLAVNKAADVLRQLRGEE